MVSLRPPHYPPVDSEIETYQKKKRKRILIGGGLATTIAGAVVFAYPTFTDIYAGGVQERLAEEFASQALEVQLDKANFSPPRSLYRIQIEALGLDSVVVEGTDAGALKAGAGHYRNTPAPCEPGNVAIAGHRTTFGKPFNRLDELRPGDVIKLSTPQESCRFRVTVPDSERSRPRPNRKSAAWITRPDDTSVLAATSGSILTLTTCHPKGSDRERLIVRAEMEL